MTVSKKEKKREREKKKISSNSTNVAKNAESPRDETKLFTWAA